MEEGKRVKIVFLDVDGVLNSSRSVLARTGARYNESYAKLENLYAEDSNLPFGVKHTLETIDPVAVSLVNRLIKESGAVLVLSTSHRLMFADRNITCESKQHMYLLGLYFAAMGIEAPIHSITPRMGTNRGTEVKQWLDESDQQVTHYVILDDARDFHSLQPLIWCDPHIGFSHTNYFAASKELGLAETSLIY